MTSSRPYLIRAMHEWLNDNELTPYVMVNAMVPDVMVPEQFIEDGKIILNISYQAVTDLIINNEAVSFTARFSGIAKSLYIPCPAIMAIYAFENGRGMAFDEDDQPPSPPKSSTPSTNKKAKPSLRIVKTNKDK